MKGDFNQWLDNKILQRDPEARQTGKITQKLRDYWAPRLRAEFDQGPLYNVEETRAIQRQEKIDAIEKDQLAEIAERNRISGLTAEQRQAEEDVQAARMLLELTESQYRVAPRARRETLELRVEQRRESLAAKERQQEVVNAHAESAKQLADDPDLAYARTSARIEVDNAAPGSDERIRASIYLNGLNNVTDPAEAKSLVREFHQWEAQQLQNRRNTLLEAQHAAIVEANPAVQRSHELGRQAGEAGLAELEARKRAEGGNE